MSAGDVSTKISIVAMLNDVMGCVVAFIPEGMPVAVAMTLLMVAKRMKATNILPNGLTTVETLGCVKVICSDKTGTLTQNRMSVVSGAFIDQSVEQDEMAARLFGENPPAALQSFFEAAALCNDGPFDPSTMQLAIDERKVQGNATDAAVLRFGERVSQGRGQASPEQVESVCDPFNSKNKWMFTLHKKDDATPTYQAYVKGAPDVLLPACTTFWSCATNSVRPLDSNAQAAFRALQDKLSRNAERVVVLCEKTMQVRAQPGTNAFSEEVARHALSALTVVGVLGILDPPAARDEPDRRGMPAGGRALLNGDGRLRPDSRGDCPSDWHLRGAEGA
jgi:sodium/potassium-transporting ATPase subunit alpha